MTPNLRHRFARRCRQGGLAALLVWALLGAGAAPGIGAADVDDFQAANKLYFEGKFAEAAAAYTKLVQAGHGSATVYFNLGNAWFKAGRNGQAVAAYLRAQHLAPRDPAVRFNLKFVREKVTGSDRPMGSAGRRWLASLTLNEWALLSAGALWVWLILLAVRETWPAARPGLRLYAVLAGAATVLLSTGCALAWRSQASTRTAVVIVPEGVVRQGPLERSTVAFKLPDGSELTVLEEQEITDQNQKQSWLQVQDSGRRIGWLKREQVAVLQF